MRARVVFLCSLYPEKKNGNLCQRRAKKLQHFFHSLLFSIKVPRNTSIISVIQ